uniref:Flagellar associated protein n=1 Tax=Chrysotila carterae TaxID=13221 RepID=A0A7S4B4M4_CHRCT
MSSEPDSPSYTRMSGKSMFGSQELSQRTSAPSYGFGSSTRTHASKVFQGAEHVKTYNYGVASPGPCYNPRSAMGKQPEGGNATMPQWQFGTERRFSQRRAGTSPGPGAYDADSAVGRQLSSHRETSPKHGFGTSNRAHMSKLFISQEHAQNAYGQTSPGPASVANASSQLGGPKYGFGTAARFSRTAQKQGSDWDSPGPAAYDVSASATSGVGAQMSSRCESQPQFGFGTSERRHRMKQFVSPNHARAEGGIHSCSPGPAAYGTNSSIGNQRTTRGQTAPTWGFSKATRFRSNSDDTGTPGPGAYAT